MCLLYSLWSILRYDLAVSDSERSDSFLIKQNFFCWNFHRIKRKKVKHIKFNLNFTYLAGKCSKFLTSITKFNLYKIVKMSDSYINTCWMRCTFFAIVYITIIFPSPILIEANDIYDPLASFSMQCIAVLLISTRHGNDINMLSNLMFSNVSFALLDFCANRTAVY